MPSSLDAYVHIHLWAACDHKEYIAEHAVSFFGGCGRAGWERVSGFGLHLQAGCVPPVLQEVRGQMLEDGNSLLEC
eukprot:465391-Pelagomonas_calceolata.AAC.2